MQNDGNEQTFLQKHAAFFDRNNDGFVYPWETYIGFRAIGAGYLLSAASAIFINLAFGPKTTSSKFPNLLFPIEVKNIKRAKHGSDSGVYDAEGRFVASKFEEIFDKFALTRKDALTSQEVKALVKTNREAKDYSGRVAAWLEWKILYVLAKDSNGLLQKDTVRGVYDGTLFEKLEKERASAPKKS